MKVCSRLTYPTYILLYRQLKKMFKNCISASMEKQHKLKSHWISGRRKGGGERGLRQISRLLCLPARKKADRRSLLLTPRDPRFCATRAWLANKLLPPPGSPSRQRAAAARQEAVCGGVWHGKPRPQLVEKGSEAVSAAVEKAFATWWQLCMCVREIEIWDIREASVIRVGRFGCIRVSKGLIAAFCYSRLH